MKSLITVITILFMGMVYSQTDDTMMIYSQTGTLDASNWNDHTSFFVNGGNRIQAPNRTNRVMMAATIFVQTDPGVLRLARGEARVVNANECINPRLAPLVEYSIVGEMHEIFPATGSVGFEAAFYTNNDRRLRLHSDDNELPSYYRNVWSYDCNFN